MSIFIVILFALLLVLLAGQYALFSEQRKSRFSHTWFSRSKLARHRMNWWKWTLLFLFIYAGCLMLIESIAIRPVEGILLFLLSAGIYWLCIKPIARISSFWKRTLSEGGLIFLLLCGVFFGYALLHRSWGLPTDEVGLQQRDFGKSFLLFLLPTFLWIMLVIHMVRYYTSFSTGKRQENALRLSRLKTQLHTAQLDSLNARINPHFLYNALNSIAGLATTDGQATRQMALALSRFFAYCSDQQAPHLVSVRQETEIAATYLEIEKIRFGKSIDVHIHIEPEVADCLVPRLLLQPLVENAVKYGRHNNTGNLSIRISVRSAKDRLSISVNDNGAPFPEDLIPGYGLKSIHDKLDVLFPDQYQVELRNEPVKEVYILLNKKTKP